jgi:hypothetical protein
MSLPLEMERKVDSTSFHVGGLHLPFFAFSGWGLPACLAPRRRHKACLLCYLQCRSLPVIGVRIVVLALGPLHSLKVDQMGMDPMPPPGTV